MERDLAITTSDGQTKILRLEGTSLSVGRSETNGVSCSADARLSRQHLKLEREGDGWTVHDLGSKNGTFLNGVRLSGKTRLQPGDRIVAGKMVLVYDPAVAARRWFSRTGRSPRAPRSSRPSLSGSRKVVDLNRGASEPRTVPSAFARRPGTRLTAAASGAFSNHSGFGSERSRG